MFGVTLAMTTVALTGNVDQGGWALPCQAPLDLLAQELRRPRPKLTMAPGVPFELTRKKLHGVSVMLLPDLVGEDWDPRQGRSLSFSTETSSKSFKSELLRRFGLIEVRSRGFGATFRFAAAPNWAFQFKGMRRVTVAYITRF